MTIVCVFWSSERDKSDRAQSRKKLDRVDAGRSRGVRKRFRPGKCQGTFLKRTMRSARKPWFSGDAGDLYPSPPFDITTRSIFLPLGDENNWKYENRTTRCTCISGGDARLRRRCCGIRHYIAFMSCHTVVVRPRTGQRPANYLLRRGCRTIGLSTFADDDDGVVVHGGRNRVNNVSVTRCPSRRNNGVTRIPDRLTARGQAENTVTVIAIIILRQR